MSRKLIYLICFVLVLGLAGTASADVSGWWNEDVGAPAPGDATESAGTFSVTGDGHDIWDSSDNFHYVYKQLTGDAEIIVRVVDVGSGSNAWAKGGVMIRQDNTRPSADAYMVLTGGEGGGAGFQWRDSAGAGAGWAGVNADPAVTPPYWVRMVRTGNSFQAFLAPDGTNWTEAAGSPHTVNMTDPVLIGLCVTSHAAGELRTMQFDNLLMTGNITDKAPQLKAWDPDPVDGATGWTSPLLSWAPGETARWHDVYLGTNPTPGAAEYKMRQPLAWNMWFETAGWIANQTYYWRIDEVEADGTTIHTGDVWSFTAAPVTAYNPNPPDDARNMPTDKQLSWTPGATAVTHDVYFGTDETEVTNGTGGTFKDNQPDAFYDPGTLAKDTKYYWRIDEKDNFGTTYPGDVWSFRTIPDIPITDPDLVGWWKLDEGSGTMAIDWSGHDNHGELRGDPQWVVQGYDGGALDFDGAGDFVFTGKTAAPLGVDGANPKTVTVWVYTRGFNNGGIWDVGTRANSEEYCLRTTGTANQWRIQFWGAQGVDDLDFTYPTLNQWVHFGLTYDGANCKAYANGEYLTGFSPTLNTSNANPFQIGCYGWQNDYFNGIIDDLRLFSKALTQAEVKETMRGDPTLAWNPNPANRSTPDIEHAELVTWSPGEKAAKHDVYFDTDEDAVIDADTTTTGIYRGRIDPNSYTPPEGVQVNETYYWRIDEYNTDATISEGRIWSYTVSDYLLIDDFEDYNDYCDRIFYTYVDGWGHSGDVACGVPPSGGNGTGSTVGYLSEPYAEQTIVHGGKQSMPFEYLNDGSTGKALYSETERTFEFPQDWTRKGMKALSLWYQGRQGPPNSSSYDAVTDTHTLTARTGDIWGNSDQFRYVYKRLSGAGSIQAKVLDVTLGASGWTKVGVMIREDLEPNSPHAFSMLTPPGRTALQHRPARAQRSNSAHSDEGKITYPYWVKIERSGNNFTAYYSSNGTTWIPQPNDETLDPDTTASNPANFAMNSNVYIGLALTSNNVNATVQAQFSNVTTTGTVTGQWQAEDIGVTSNDAEQLYVAVEDSGGTVKVAEHPNPNAVQLDTWQHWDIDLADFAPVDLTKVKKIYIGVGNRSDPKLGGGGMLYIDDIRLYAPRCFPSRAKPEADFNSNCVVDYPDLQILADEWLFETQLQDWEERVAYWDAVYPTGWADVEVTEAVRDYLALNGYTVVDANELKTWMDARIADGKLSVVVFCHDVVPDTVAETMDPNCTVRKYLDAGGKVVWYSDIPFYYQGHADGSSTNWGTGGSSAVLGFNAAGAGWDSGDTATIFTAGANWGLTQTWNSLRPTTAGDVDIVLATDSDGDAAAWAKHYVPGDHSRGFVRIADFNVGPGDTDLLPDLLSVAESKGPLAADLYEDDVINFRDYSIIAGSWLEEVLWP